MASEKRFHVPGQMLIEQKFQFISGGIPRLPGNQRRRFGLTGIALRDQGGSHLEGRQLVVVLYARRGSVTGLNFDMHRIRGPCSAVALTGSRMKPDGWDYI